MAPVTLGASSTSVAAGTTRETRPKRSASSASTMRPMRHISIALDLPTTRVKRCLPPAPGIRAELELGGVASKNEIARHRKLASPAEREARDRAITGLWVLATDVTTPSIEIA